MKSMFLELIFTCAHYLPSLFERDTPREKKTGTRRDRGISGGYALFVLRSIKTLTNFRIYRIRMLSIAQTPSFHRVSCAHICAAVAGQRTRANRQPRVGPPLRCLRRPPRDTCNVIAGNTRTFLFSEGYSSRFHPSRAAARLSGKFGRCVNRGQLFP